ncbi:MAG: hypothetical protein ABIZ18_14280, partial [Caldimonas sp.]
MTYVGARESRMNHKIDDQIDLESAMKPHYFTHASNEDKIAYVASSLENKLSKASAFFETV